MSEVPAPLNLSADILAVVACSCIVEYKQVGIEFFGYFDKVFTIRSDQHCKLLVAELAPGETGRFPAVFEDKNTF